MVDTEFLAMTVENNMSPGSRSPTSSIIHFLIRFDQATHRQITAEHDETSRRSEIVEGAGHTVLGNFRARGKKPWSLKTVGGFNIEVMESDLSD